MSYTIFLNLNQGITLPQNVLFMKFLTLNHSYKEKDKNFSLNNTIDPERVFTRKRELNAENNSSIINGLYHWIQTGPLVLRQIFTWRSDWWFCHEIATKFFTTKLYLTFTWTTLVWPPLKINETLTTISQYY